MITNRVKEIKEPNGELKKGKYIFYLNTIELMENNDGDFHEPFNDAMHWLEGFCHNADLIEPLAEITGYDDMFFTNDEEILREDLKEWLAADEYNQFIYDSDGLFSAWLAFLNDHFDGAKAHGWKIIDLMHEIDLTITEEAMQLFIEDNEALEISAAIEICNDRLSDIEDTILDIDITKQELDYYSREKWYYQLILQRLTDSEKELRKVC